MFRSRPAEKVIPQPVDAAAILLARHHEAVGVIQQRPVGDFLQVRQGDMHALGDIKEGRPAGKGGDCSGQEVILPVHHIEQQGAGVDGAYIYGQYGFSIDKRGHLRGPLEEIGNGRNDFQPAFNQRGDRGGINTGEERAEGDSDEDLPDQGQAFDHRRAAGRLIGAGRWR